MELETPRSLKKEHDELHAQPAGAKEAGRTAGKAAKSVAKVLHPHFLKEEEYALPQLRLLPVLAQGQILPFAEKLRLHAQNEEEVLYPASILIGEYLRLKLSEKRDR